MNIAFFLTPKVEVICLDADSTVRQAMEKMEAHRYSAIPMIDERGHYVCTLTEGDLLWFLKHCGHESWIDHAEQTPVLEVPRRFDLRPVHIDAEMEQLVALAKDQNFVPVIDDRDVFVGIVRRSTIIDYLARKVRPT